MHLATRLLPLMGVVLILAAGGALPAQEKRRLILPEQRQIEFRTPEQLPKVRLPDIPPPPTVSHPPGDTPWSLSLDEVIRIALANAEVVRIAAGNTAVSSGETIYDPAISNTLIDQSRARFDPTVQSDNTFSRINQPQGIFVTPSQVQIQGTPTQGFQSSSEISKTLITGGSLGLSANVNQNRYDADGFPLNPQTGNNVAASITQPFLKGAGAPANLAPILIARINTERSFFQLKDSVQDLVLSAIQVYWNLSYAQRDVWARQQQVEQGQEAFKREKARLKSGFGDVGDMAQAQVSYENFRALLINAQANLLNQEAVLRNLLGLSPSDPRPIQLTTPPYVDHLQSDWQRVLRLAGTYRPDIIELKLILEADEQQLIYSKNQALPEVNLGALYRWNGLEGRTPDGQYLSTPGGKFTDWEAGINFSVPLGLRKERAAIRETELLIARDRANIQQSLHATAHTLAASFRNLAQYYEQYQAYGRMRAAAHLNLQRQMADFMVGRKTLYLNVLQAITDWGNAVNFEYLALTLYNTELAQLERQTGTILETHGIRFVEERYRSIGPLGRLGPEPCYPRGIRPGPNANSPPPPSEHRYEPPGPIRLPQVEEETPPVPEVLPPPRAQPPETKTNPQ
jgi:outer membrane protein TolC